MHISLCQTSSSTQVPAAQDQQTSLLRIFLSQTKQSKKVQIVLQYMDRENKVSKIQLQQLDI